MQIRTYEEFLNLTVKEVNDLIHEAVRKNKVAEGKELAKWLSRVQTEHIMNFVKSNANECKNLYEYARGGK